jgi:hypothetical protein
VSWRHSSAAASNIFQLTDRSESTGSADGGDKSKDDGRGKLHGDGLGWLSMKDVKGVFLEWFSRRVVGKLMPTRTRPDSGMHFFKI